MNRYISTILNFTLGWFWFEKVILPRQTGNNGQVVLSFDPDDRIDIEMMPWLLDELKNRKMKASFAAIGVWVQQYPDLWKRVRDEGHEIINHTYDHPDNAELNQRHYHHLTYDERKEQIAKCHQVVKDILGIEMGGFRTPHFGYQHTYDTYKILEELGYEFSTSVVAISSPNGRPYTVGSVREFPLTYCPKHPWALFDSSHAFRGKFCKHTPEDFLVQWKRLLESGCFLSIYLDPQDLKKFDFPKMLDMIDRAGLTTVTYEELL